jgi:hypothetical protein
MNPPVGATRRQVLLGGAATVLSVGFSGSRSLSSFAAASLTDRGLRLGSLLHVIRPGNSAFDERLEKHYPGLLSLPGFEIARPLTLMIRNRSEHDALAISAAWLVKYPSGNEKLYRYAAFFRPNKFIRASRSGQYPVIRSHKLCLFSPFFCWTPARFKSVSAPDIVLSLLRQEPAKNQLSHDIASAISIKGRLDAGIFDPKLLVGADKAGLGSFFTVVCQAERDEATSLLTELGASASGKSLRDLATQHAATPVGNASSPEERIYRRTRVRYASLVRRALRYKDKNSVMELLESARASSPVAVIRNDS